MFDTKLLRVSARRLTLFGVVTMILGCAAIAAPFVTGLSVVMAVGVLVTVAGIMRMVWAFGTGSFGKGLLAFAIGGLALLCGLSLVTYPLSAFGFLSVWIALYLFADGIADIVGAFRLQESGRVWLFIGGVASIFLGVMIWRQYPLSGGLAIGIMLGVRMLFAGTAMLAAASAARSIAKIPGGTLPQVL